MQNLGAIAAAKTPMRPIPISELTNDSLIIRLHFTVNHLSRWLTPVHDWTLLERSTRRGEPSAKELLLRLRDEELRVFPQLHLIATRTVPDLDGLALPARTPAERLSDQEAKILEVMAEFRRLRQSTCGLLRSLPDGAWTRVGISRREHDWTIRALAEHLATHDLETLGALDRALEGAGVRSRIATVSRARLDQVVAVSPETIK